ncbi:MAG: hypothetical protein FIB07_17970 [Candidatus Methanoperedens sp.]|nr:hypothetical protein [Candidatus Methanoperedens sp.]
MTIQRKRRGNHQYLYDFSKIDGKLKSTYFGRVGDPEAEAKAKVLIEEQRKKKEEKKNASPVRNQEVAKRKVESRRRYDKTHPKERRARSRRYAKAHPKEHQARSRKCAKAHPEVKRKRDDRHRSKRRSYGSESINATFKNSHFHHFLKEIGIYVPESLHSTPHSHLLRDFEKLRRVNKKVLAWLNEHPIENMLVIQDFTRRLEAKFGESYFD